MDIKNLQGEILQGCERYVIGKLIDFGGHGFVYKTQHQFLNKTLAIKVVATDDLDSISLQRLNRECLIGGELGNVPGIVEIHDAFIDRNLFCMVMDLMKGGNLNELIKQENLHLKETIRWARILSNALNSVHQRNILHRDIKPENILFTDAGEPKLCDFGIAHIPKSNFTEVQPGTPGYKAPELEEGGEPTFASDVYSLCATFFCVWTGCNFASYKSQSLGVINEEFITLTSNKYPNERKEIIRTLASIIIRGLNPDPQKRLTLDNFRDRISMIYEHLKQRQNLAYLHDYSSIKLIEDLFTNKFWKKTNVVKQVSDIDDLKSDLDILIFTSEFRRDLRSLSHYFLADQWEEINNKFINNIPLIWINGDFGIGKSYLAKIFTNLLVNPSIPKQGLSFIEKFKEKLDIENSNQDRELLFLLNQIHDVYLCEAVHIDTLFLSSQEISNNLLAQMILIQTFRSRGFSSIQWIARLQKRLRKEKLYSKFIDDLPSDFDINDTNYISFIEPDIFNALKRTLELTNSGVEKFINECKKTQTADEMIEEIIDLVFDKNINNDLKTRRTIFIIDEIDQILNSQKELMSSINFIEQLLKRGKGQIWALAISQNDSNDYFRSFNQSNIRIPHFMSLQLGENYPFQLSRGLLTGKTIQGRLLILDMIQKNPDVSRAINNIAINFIDLGMESFTDTYPFPPYSIKLIYELFDNIYEDLYKKMRTRVIFSIIREIMIIFSQKPFGAIVSFDLFFDHFDWKFKNDIIEIIENAYKNNIYDIKSIGIIKVLGMINIIKWFPATPSNVALLLINHLEVDINEHMTEIKFAVGNLIDKGFINKNPNDELSLPNYR
ncbi:MAG: protein kinase [Brevefilum sp.]|nr:protein kinase [Brevefilum sp.]